MPDRPPRVTPRACFWLHRSGLIATRHGVTLIELLVAVALTLMVILAIVRVFDILGGNVTESRAILELSGELRNASNLLQTDLDSLTAPTVPPLEPQSGLGYLEIVEGPRTDWDSDGDRLLNSSEVVNYLNPYRLAGDLTGDPDGFTPAAVGEFDPPYLDNVSRVLGDTDDVLMGTIRSRGAPFIGRFLGGTIQSELAEVVWWVEPVQLPLPPGTPPGAFNTNPAIGLRIHRRVLLIRPDLNVQLQAFITSKPLADLAALRVWLANNDLSVRPSGNLLIANSLDDLTRRENRLGHWPDVFQRPDWVLDPSVFPFRLNRLFLVPSSDRSDVVLGDALAFDVRVFDPSAPLLRSAGEAYMVAPTDPGFFHLVAAGQAVPQGHGAFVDLGYGYFGKGAGLPPALNSHFSRLPHPKSQLTPFDTAPRVYCTWSTRYERDGVNQDRVNWSDPERRFPSRQNEGANLVDEGTNGLDDLQDDTGIPGLVDDLNEHETSPPYPVPLRGVEVVLRAQEYSTRQVRQSSVVGDFQPE